MAHTQLEFWAVSMQPLSPTHRSSWEPVLPNSSLHGDSPAHLRARYHQATRPVATTRHATDDFSQSSLFVEVLVDVIPRLRLFRFRQ